MHSVDRKIRLVRVIIHEGPESIIRGLSARNKPDGTHYTGGGSTMTIVTLPNPVSMWRAVRYVYRAITRDRHSKPAGVDVV